MEKKTAVEKALEQGKGIGSLTPKIPQSLDWLIFFCQNYIFVLRTTVLYSKMYLYQYIPGGYYAIKI